MPHTKKNTVEEVCDTPDALVRENRPVLESLRPGTHPEVIAKALHTLESMVRSTNPIVRVNFHRVEVWSALVRLFLSLEPPTTGT
jgi:transcriptional regulator with AAA-type ATPase domain